MAIPIEDLVGGEERGQFRLLCDFELDSREPEEKAVAVAKYLREIGLPWLERFRRVADIQEACWQGDKTVDKAMSAQGWSKFRALGYSPFKGDFRRPVKPESTG